MRLIEILRWPVIAIVITGMLHLAAEAALPDLKTAFVPASLAPLLLAFGLWVGSRGAQLGASFPEAVLAGAVLGLLPLALDVVGFGILLNRGTNAGLVAGVFGLLTVTFGALLGAGYRLSGRGTDA
jgi:hypothetical protein